MICTINVIADISTKKVYTVCRRFTDYTELWSFTATYSAPLTIKEARKAIQSDTDLDFNVTYGEVEGVRQILEYSPDFHISDIAAMSSSGDKKDWYDIWNLPVRDQRDKDSLSPPDLYDWYKYRLDSTPQDLPIGLNNTAHSCEHNWISYYGLVETFTYCGKCDKKAD